MLAYAIEQEGGMIAKLCRTTFSPLGDISIQGHFVLLGYFINQEGGMIAKLFRTIFPPLGVISWGP